MCGQGHLLDQRQRAAVTDRWCQGLGTLSLQLVVAQINLWSVDRTLVKNGQGKGKAKQSQQSNAANGWIGHLGQGPAVTNRWRHCLRALRTEMIPTQIHLPVGRR